MHGSKGKRWSIFRQLIKEIQELSLQHTTVLDSDKPRYKGSIVEAKVILFHCSQMELKFRT